MSADKEDVTITKKDLTALKNDVLKENIYEISTQLGDPGRCFASFKAKEILDRTDCETIKAQVTSMEKANVFIDAISGRCGRKGEHPYDVFVGALKRMKVHIHIVRILNQALAKKIVELKTTKRVQNTDVDDGSPTVSGNNNDPITNGFPTNGSSVISRGAGVGPVNMMSAPVTTSSPTSSSSSTSSSSIYPRTPSSSHVTTPTDHASSSYPTSHVVTASGLPRLPVGTQEEPRSEYSTSSSQWEESSIQATPSTTDVDTEVGPIPSSLPVGFNSDCDGSRDNEDVSALLANTPDKGYHPVIGPLPPQPPPSMGSQNGFGSQSSIDESVLKSLQERVGALEKNKLMLEEHNKSLEREVVSSRKHFVHLQEQLKHIVMERDVLANERDKMSAIIRHLESQLSILRQGGGGREKTTSSGRLLSPNLHATTAQPRLENRRLTDPYFKDLNPKHPPQHRPSDPNLRYLSHHTAGATRPNNLPLGIAPGGSHYPPSISYQDTPLPLDVRVPPTSRMFRQSPGSDSSADGLTPNYFKVSASADDLTSGGEDRNSIHSFGSNHSGGGGGGGAKINFELLAAANTQSTVV